jgi:hypothetical protein
LFGQSPVRWPHQELPEPRRPKPVDQLPTPMGATPTPDPILGTRHLSPTRHINTATRGIAEAPASPSPLLPHITAIGIAGLGTSIIGMAGIVKANCSTPASIHLPRAGLCDCCKSGRASAARHLSRRHAAHKIGPHPLSAFRRCESSGCIRREVHGAEFPRGGIAGSAAAAFQPRADRPGPTPIVHSAWDRRGQVPASRDPIGAQPGPPAFPSASERAFASLRVARSSWMD